MGHAKCDKNSKLIILMFQVFKRWSELGEISGDEKAQKRHASCINEKRIHPN